MPIARLIITEAAIRTCNAFARVAVVVAVVMAGTFPLLFCASLPTWRAGSTIAHGNRPCPCRWAVVITSAASLDLASAGQEQRKLGHVGRQEQHDQHHHDHGPYPARDRPETEAADRHADEEAVADGRRRHADGNVGDDDR